MMSDQDKSKRFWLFCLEFCFLFVPRAALLALGVFTDCFSTAYTTPFWPIVGFMICPFSILALTATILNNPSDHAMPFWIFLVFFAIIADMIGLAPRPRES
jgi:hypothetical protein